MNLRAPNYTQIPNEILDRSADMTPAEFKVIIEICRRTFGWQKDRDVITLSQLEDATGLTRPTVQAAITSAMERHWLDREQVGKQMYSYWLVLTDNGPVNTSYKPVNSVNQLPVNSVNQPVNTVNQLTEITGNRSLPVPVNSVVRFDPKPVNSVYTQKKDLKKLKENDDDDGGDSRGEIETSLRRAGLDGTQITTIMLACGQQLTLDYLNHWHAAILHPPKAIRNPRGLMITRLSQGDLTLPVNGQGPPPTAQDDADKFAALAATYGTRCEHCFGTIRPEWDGHCPRCEPEQFEEQAS